MRGSGYAYSYQSFLVGGGKRFDGKSLTKEQMLALLEYYRTCMEPRRKEFLEMFFFAFHACGLRVVDVMTLQWKHIDFARNELRKVMIKTNQTPCDTTY